MPMACREDHTLGEGPFILVTRDGRALGRIFYTAGMYRFFLGDHETLGDPDLVDANLERLEAAIRTRYDRTVKTSLHQSRLPSQWSHDDDLGH